MRAAEEVSLASEKHLETLREQRDNKARSKTQLTFLQTFSKTTGYPYDLFIQVTPAKQQNTQP